MKKKSTQIWKSSITKQTEYRQLQKVICHSTIYIIYGECLILLFQCICLSIILFYEFIGIMIFQCLIVVILLRMFNKVKRLLILKQECKNCKQLIFCQICHHCDTIVLHVEFIEMCLDEDQIKLLKNIVGVFFSKIIAQIIIQSYTVMIIEKTMQFYTAFLTIIIIILFVNIVLLLLLILLSWKVSIELRIKQQIITPKDEFKIIEQQEKKCLEIINIQQEKKCLKILHIQEEQKKQTPDQQEIEDKGSLNVSINEDMSPAMLKLKSSLSPSPGRYRSGKILDFLEKKLSHAKLSQKELHNGYSKEYSRKYNTNQALQISVDFGEQENISSSLNNKIEIEIKNHNFFKQTKFIS